MSKPTKNDLFEATQMIRLRLNFKPNSDTHEKFLKWLIDEKVFIFRGDHSSFESAEYYVPMPLWDKVVEWLELNGVKQSPVKL